MYGLRTLARSLRWVRSRFTSERALILAYHSISNSSWDPCSLCVAPVHFVEHLKLLRRYANPISLQAMVDGLRDGNLAPRSVVVTLDDGYVDNLRHAKPALQHLDIPATVFVTTGHLGKTFWWDHLAILCAPGKPFPRTICLEINGHKFDWRSNGSARMRHRLHFFSSVHRFLSYLAEPERDEAITKLCQVFMSATHEDPDRRAMTGSEIRDLAKGGLIEVGAHTASHPFLGSLGIEAQRGEISASKQYLQEILSMQIESFCYPHGSLTNETVAAVRNAGFRCACATYTDVATLNNDPFLLPRFWIQNCNGVQFGRWLHRWMGSTHMAV